MNSVQPLRLSMNKVCGMLDIIRQGLRKLIQEDPSFPRGLKSSPSRQAHVYFDYQDLMDWYANEKRHQKAS